MGALSDGARRGVAWADARLADLRERLTPGQRWTAALALALAAVVLAFGTPTPRVEVASPASGGQPATVTPTTAGEPELEHPSEGTDVPLLRAAAPAADAGAPPGPSGPVGAEEQRSGAEGPPAGRDGAEPRFSMPDVVALARAQGDGGSVPPGRGDAAMAETYLSTASFPGRVEELDPDADPAETCTSLSAVDLVVAGHGLPRELTRCLLSLGVTVVSHDSMGFPQEPGALSTRRPLRDALVDLVAWAESGGRVDGTVGIAAGAVLEPEVDAAVARLARAGLDPVVHYVEDRASAAEGARAFADEGVTTTVFALAVEHQRAWLAADALLVQRPRYLVADAGDAVTVSEHPPSFDGALAHTSQRFPWAEETDLRERCRTQWEAEVSGPVLDDRELHRALSWCQHVEIVGTAIRQARGEDRLVGDVLAELEHESTLTSGLGPLRDGGWGPRRDHVLRWEAACSCWSDEGEAADRSP